MKTRNVLIALVAVVLLCGMSRSAEAQECLCGEFGECGDGPWTPITNLEDPKPPDLILCATDAYPESCESNWQNRRTRRVSTVQGAIFEILQAPGWKLNVLVQGHGMSGVQCFGPGDECIGNNPPYAAKKAKFILAVRGKIKTLTFLGCSTAAAPKGQGFLAKLSKELGAGFVKGWTGTNRVWSNKGGYETEGNKKARVPTLPVWGLIGLVVLLVAGGAVLFARRRAPVTD